MKKESKPRVLIGLVEVAGYFHGLAEGFRELGYEVDYWTLTKHPFSYEDKSASFLVRTTRRVGQLLDRKNQSGYLKSLLRAPIYLLYGCLSLTLFITSLFRFDVYIFGAHSRFLPFFLDLPLLKFFGKKVIWVFLGSDSRPPYLDGILAAQPTNQLNTVTRKNYRIVRWVDRWADVVVDQYGACLFHGREIVNFLEIGIPMVVPELPTSAPADTFTIIHAPSAPKEKGTYEIRAAIDELKKEGLEINYVELTHKTNAEVLEALGQCDLAVDQLFSDTPMAKFAAEAALLGKPVVVGGYDLEAMAERTRKAHQPPSVLVKPGTLKDSLRQLLAKRDKCRQLGEDANRFVHEKWLAKEVAGRFVKLMSGDYPDAWRLEPEDQPFVHGWGLSIESRNEVVTNLVSMFGEQSLQLDDKPSQRTKLLRECGIGA